MVECETRALGDYVTKVNMHLMCGICAAFQHHMCGGGGTIAQFALTFVFYIYIYFSFVNVSPQSDQ